MIGKNRVATIVGPRFWHMAADAIGFSPLRFIPYDWARRGRMAAQTFLAVVDALTVRIVACAAPKLLPGFLAAAAPRKRFHMTVDAQAAPVAACNEYCQIGG